MKRGVWYLGATLPPRVRQTLPAGASHIGQSKRRIFYLLVIRGLVCKTSRLGQALTGHGSTLTSGAWRVFRVDLQIVFSEV
jgi:hypothetical protein